MTELNHTQKVKRIYKNRTGQSDKWMLQFCFCIQMKYAVKEGANFCNTCFVVIKNEMKLH